MKILNKYITVINQSFRNFLSLDSLVVVPLTLLSTIALAGGSISLPPTTVVPPIEHASNVFVDLTGRQVIMHGANIMNKIPPYYYPSFYDPDGQGSTIGEDWAKFFATNGFNVARVGIAWEGVEPSPGVYDDSYILHVRDMVRMFAKYGVYCILDFHQDAWTDQPVTGMTPPTFGGDMFPAWAANFGGQPNNNDYFPFNVYSSAALRSVWDNFWNNVPVVPSTIGIQDAYIKMYAHVVKLFKYEPNLLYYGAMNEPGVDIQTWQSLGSPDFITWITTYQPNILSQGSNSTFFLTKFADFHDKLNAAVHKADPIHMVGNDRSFYEIAGDHIPVVRTPKDNNVVLARSFYGSQNSAQSPADYLQSLTIAKNKNMGFFAQEWGSNIEGDGTVNAYPPVVSYLDKNNISWTYWDFAQFPGTLSQNQTFDTTGSISNWFIQAGNPTVTQSSTIGQPAPSMSVNFVSVPSAQPNGIQVSETFLAKDISQPGRTISMDVMVTADSIDACPGNPCFSTYMILVTKNGPNYNFVPQLQGSLVADGQWHHFSGPVLPDGGSPLNDVRELTLGFFGTPAGNEHIYVDNIQITGAPFQPVTNGAVTDILLATDSVPVGNAINTTELNMIVEPYPRAIAGSPISYQFNPSTHTFTMSYSKIGASGREVSFLLPTEIFVPVSDYPNGYNVDVNGGYVISAPNANVLLLIRNPFSSTVNVTITSK